MPEEEPPVAKVAPELIALATEVGQLKGAVETHAKHDENVNTRLASLDEKVDDIKGDVGEIKTSVELLVQRVDTRFEADDKLHEKQETNFETLREEVASTFKTVFNYIYLLAAGAAAGQILTTVTRGRG